MIVGNKQAREMIHQFFLSLQTGKTVFPFLLLAGRAHVGKTTVIEEEIQQMLGQYMSTDYVALYDISEQLTKEHTIKIEAPRGEEYVAVEDKQYCNR
jgi:hypothetical protein